MNSVPIGRGWLVISADKKRVGDVTEVHPTYLLVSRGVLRVKDMYLPLGTVDHSEGTTVILTVTQDVLRKMDLSHEPAPLSTPDDAPLNDPPPSQQEDYSTYPSESDSSEPLAFPGAWPSEDSEYDETPSYARPLPNGLIEAEHALNLAYSDLGYGVPTVLLQGWPFDSSIWEPLPYDLATYNRTITFDMRGSGESDKPWDFYSIDTLAGDLHRVMVEQGLHNVTLVAWSSAALLALRYALEHPKRLTRIVLISPLIFSWLSDEDAITWLGRKPELDQDMLARWETELIEDRPALFERFIDRMTLAALSAPRRQWVLNQMLHGAQHAQIKIFDALRTEDPASWLPDITTPVTILHGTEDRLSPPALSEHLAGLLPRCQVVMIDDCGHTPFLEKREAVTKAINDLLNTYDEEPTPSADDALESPESVVPQDAISPIEIEELQGSSGSSTASASGEFDESSDVEEPGGISASDATPAGPGKDRE